MFDEEPRDELYAQCLKQTARIAELEDMVSAAVREGNRVRKAVDAKDARIAELEAVITLFIKQHDAVLPQDSHDIYQIAIEAAKAAMKDTTT